MQENTQNEEFEEPPTDITYQKYQRILKQIWEHLHKAIFSFEHQSVLSSLGIKGKELLEELSLGYMDQNFMQRIPNGKEGSEIKGLLQEIGLVKEKGRSLYPGYVLFPMLDDKQNLVNIYGKRAHRYKGVPEELWLNENINYFFNPKALNSKEIIFTKTIWDAISFWGNGFHNVTFFEAPANFTDYHLGLIAEANIEKVYLAYPNDELEKENCERLALKMSSVNITSQRLKIPESLSIKQHLERVKAPQQELQFLLQTAQAMRISSATKTKVEKIQFKTTDSKEQLDWHKKNDSYLFQVGQRNYSITGVDKNLSTQSMKIRIKIRIEEKNHRDNGVDLYSHKTLKRLIKSSSDKLEIEPQIIEKDLDKIINILEEIQEELIEKALKDNTKQEVTLSQIEIDEAMLYLKDPELIERIIKDFFDIGLVGEDINAITGYIAASSRKESKPLAVIIQSSSGAGKTTIMDAILSLMPEEDVIKFSAMTGQSIYYMGEKSLKHKILAIVEEEGAEKVSYSLKLLQSDGRVSIASTGKDPETGKLVTHEYVVEGPVSIFIATTNIDIDEELKNRCVILTVNESREQTKRIHQLQRKIYTLDGVKRKSKSDKILKLHQNMQRLLRPIIVINPFADLLTFTDKEHTMRRDHLKYLTLISTITWLHQYQREIKTDTDAKGKLFEYIEVTIADIQLAHRLANKVFGASLDDLPPQTRTLLNQIHDFVEIGYKKKKLDREDFRFNRRDIRELTGMKNSRLAIHLDRVEEYEYIIRHRGRRGQSVVYELVYNGEGKDGETFLPGLIEPKILAEKILRRKAKS